MTRGSGKDVWRRENVSSPCINLCVIHPQAKLCTGCLRSTEEIAAWSRMSEEERRRIMAELPARGPLRGTRRGGHRGRTGRSRDPSEGE